MVKTPQIIAIHLHVSTGWVYPSYRLGETFEKHLSAYKELRMKEIYAELANLESEHYFFKWCKDNFNKFSYDDVNYGGAVAANCEIFGGRIETEKIILTALKENHTVVIQLKDDEVFQNIGEKLN